MTDLKPAPAHAPPSATGPLAGLLVLDFGQAAVGPIAAEYLGMLGATVIKVESPRGDTVRHGKPTMKGTGTTFIGNNITKYGIVLDLKSPEGKAHAMRLIQHADVLIENFRSAEVMVRLGLGYEVIGDLNPNLIYVSASAYGRGGPLENMRSNEWLSEALSGFTSLSGVQNGAGEFSRGSANLDWNGAMLNTVVLLAALVRRGRGSGGGFFATSQLGSSIFAGITRFAEILDGGLAPVPLGSRHPALAPDEAFRTKNGYLAITTPTERSWLRLCHALGIPELAVDERFSSNAARLRARDALKEIIESSLSARTSTEWSHILGEAGVACGEFRTSASLLDTLHGNPQIEALGLVRRVPSRYGPVASQSPHWQFGETPAKIEKGPPLLGEHTALVLANLNSKQELLAVLGSAGKNERDNPGVAR